MGPGNSPDRESYCSVCRKASCCWRRKPAKKLKYWGINLREPATACTLRLLSVESETDPKWACLHETWTGPGPYLDLSSSGPISYRFQEVPCERKAYLDPIWDRSQIYPVPCKRGLNLTRHLGHSRGSASRSVQQLQYKYYYIVEHNRVLSWLWGYERWNQQFS